MQRSAFWQTGQHDCAGQGCKHGDGWETRRRREPGNDWAILALAHPGKVERILVDTAYFKGNYPAACSIEAVNLTEDSALNFPDLEWQKLLPKQALSADAEHEFGQEVAAIGPISHVRLNIFPDGGISRLRLFGTIVSP